MILKTLISASSLQKAAVVFLLGTMAAPLAAKFDWWHYRDAFGSLKILFYFGVAVMGLSLLMMCLRMVKQRGSDAVPYGIAVLIASLPIGMMIYQVSQVRSLPYIHDITTDMVNPPQFKAVLAMRAEDDNSADYAGEAIATEQREAYGDIAPIMTDLVPLEAFKQMRDTLEDLGFTIHQSDVSRGHIEASDTTFWFGFVDDIVVRVTGVDEGSRIDIRSASRVGKSDIGKNAQRIRAIIAAFK